MPFITTATVYRKVTVTRKMKFYAVKQGLKVGIYTKWEDCLTQVKGYPGAKYKSFYTREEAQIYLDDDGRCLYKHVM